MGVVGLIEWNWENDAHVQAVHTAALRSRRGGSSLNMRKEVVDEHPEVCDFFNAMTTLPSRKSRLWFPRRRRHRHARQSPSRKLIPLPAQVCQH